MSLGEAETQLRERFGDALRELEVTRTRSLHEQVRPPPPSETPAGPPFADQKRLQRRLAEGDVQRAEYDLHAGRVFRIRWQLAERFERPVMADLVAHLTRRLGEPSYDQTLRAKLGSGKADLRRVGWVASERAFELRQLHPFGGGPTYLTLTDLPASQAIVAAGGVVMPQPETSPAWWRDPRPFGALPTAQERQRLAAALDVLVDALGFAQKTE